MTEADLETVDLPEHLQKLDEALSALGDDVMALSELDGLLAAVNACPEAIPPEEWLPLIWGDEEVDDEALLADPQVPQTVALVLARLDEIAAELARGESAFEPIYDVDSRSGEPLWEIWIGGFQKGMSLRVDAWEALHAKGGDAADALELLMTLASLAEGDDETKAELGKKNVEQLLSTASEVLPECVEVLAWAARPREPVRSVKVGRNEPCACGSGKKFKKCCGAA